MPDSPPSLPHVLLDRFTSSPWELAYEVREGAGWRAWTWRQVESAVRELSAGLIAYGITPGDCVAILAGTRLEWILADFAVLCTGAATTTIYPSSTPAECLYILGDADVRAVFVEDDVQRAKVEAVRGELPALEHVIGLDGPEWNALIDAGRTWLAKHGADAWRERALSPGPEDLATLIYTSGTTGPPKGVRLVHDCWIAQAEALAETIEDNRQPDDKLFVWLPLAHAYGKVLQLAGVAYGVPTAIDGDIDRLGDNLAETRPTYVPAVPRVFEKMHQRILGRVRGRGPRAARVFGWASDVGRQVSRLRQAGERVPVLLRLQHAVADRLVFRAIRAAFGGRIRAFLSGSAPLSPELHHFFNGAGLPILEGYGLTECAAVATANRPDDLRLGTVGQPGLGMQVKISDTGEVLLRGRAVMRGYHRRPDANAEAFTDGWFRTGDLGRIDGNGFLHITGRIKELIITSGGKNIAPAPIEHAIKAACPFLQEVVMHGDGRHFCSAIVTLEAEAAAAWAAQRGKPAGLAELAGDPDVRATIQGAVDAVNATLPSFATVKGFVVLERELTLEADELTPSQKVRRGRVHERYGALLDPLYA